MIKIVDFPLLVFALSLVMMWISSRLGASFNAGRLPLKKEEEEDFSVVRTATLTLLGLIIAFAFSMATTRYDQRKNYEAEEANAIGTEYARAGLLSPADAERVRKLLTQYVDARLSAYTIRDQRRLEQVYADTTRLQDELWSVVQTAAAAQPTPMTALAVSGMNDVLNSQGYAQAAWRNRIPVAAWSLMVVIALGCNLLVGYGAHQTNNRLFLILPLAVSISFFFIADIDTPKGGVIRVLPHNLASLGQSLAGK